MKPLRQQIVDRIRALGGEKPEFYESFSDYDLLEDYENLLRDEVESEFTNNNIETNADE
jgi:hypothetical protein